MSCGRNDEMDVRSLFTSFEGRIGRAEWWAGTIPLIILSTLLVSVIAGFSVSLGLHTAAILDALVYLALFRPAYAVAAKRFQDRDKPGIIALYGLIPWTIISLSQCYAFLFLGTVQEQSKMFALICVAVIWGVELWFIIELGILKGTPGPNRFDVVSTDATATRGVLHAWEVIVGRLFTYLVSAAGAAILAAIINSIMHFMPMVAILPLIPVYTKEPTLLFDAAVVLSATGCALIGFLLATPFARLALRVLPVDPFATRTVRHRLILAFCLLGIAVAIAIFIVTAVGFFLYFTKFEEVKLWRQLDGYQDAEQIRNQAVVRFGWSSVVLGILYIFLRLMCEHLIAYPSRSQFSSGDSRDLRIAALWST
jgi:uncharacterized membrane protein YhaH (DUF805 family)